MKPVHLLSLLLVAGTVGCQASAPLMRTPDLKATTPVADSYAQAELSIRWPYRAQVIPTSTQRLVIRVQGRTTQTTTVDRPAGEAPLSVANLDLEANDTYQIAVDAYDGANSGLPVASGESDPFEALPNKKIRVTVSLRATYVPGVETVSPDNGGPGTVVTIGGANFGLGRGFMPTFSVGGIVAPHGTASGSDAVTIRLPAGATTGLVGMTVDGVPGAASTASFTVLSGIGVTPVRAGLAPGGGFDFTAQATADTGFAFVGPSVEWSLVPMPDPAYVNPDPDSPPAGTPYLPSLGTIDGSGHFVSNGATGSQWVQIVSGSLVATAAIDVGP